MPEPISTNPLPKLEQDVLSFWKQKNIAKQNLEADRGQRFVFFEGPPTANAGPAFHHVIARIFKDIIPRYKFLKGFSVPRKAGWDTHGLPVELQIEKEIGTKTKPDIENYGIAKFNRKCQESVWRFKQDWERFTERIGFWLDLDRPYITYDPKYMESVWWLLKKIWQKGLLKQDYKVVPYCARCGTPLSSHEVAQGYKDIEDNSVYLKFRVKPHQTVSKEALSIDDNTYLLVWTTTPWTLPSNVALAVGNDIEYEIWEENGENLIVAAGCKERIGISGKQKEGGSPLFGRGLVGLEYEPLFDINGLKSESSYKVYDADFVSTAEGTGIVHIAPMYGEDDFKLGKQHGLPEHHLVGADGAFTQDLPDWQGMWVKDADPKIIDFLKKRGSLYKTESITHTYPFCWRCHSPLLYYAHQSWFILMSQLREPLLKNNQEIHWEPGHLQQGRFGEWLREVKDWALSRNRYWGTPLPVWQCSAEPKHQIAVGSIKELSDRAYQPNTYFLMRHGEATSNTKGYNAGWPEKEGMVSELTDKGKNQVAETARDLKQKNIGLIIGSDLIRTRQTIDILQKELSGVEVRFDERLREVNFGDLDYQSFKEFVDVFLAKAKSGALFAEIFEAKANNGESPLEVQRRVTSLMADLEKEFNGKNILIVSHGLPLWVFQGRLKNLGLQETYELGQQKNAEVRICVSPNLPYNEKQELDLHRPYIDEIFLACPECGAKMARVSPVIDCWFDSGSMPYAQHHFPFAFLKPGDDPDTVDYQILVKDKLQFPADYIAEAIDQTRGWFYTLHAIATALDLGPAYRNVVCMGHVLDEKGEKMSKSKGNIIDPWLIMDRYGVDALRWYFYTVNSPGEYKKFSEKDLGQSSAELMVVLNVCNFFTMYAPESIKVNHPPIPETLLEKWISDRVRSTADEVGQLLDDYKIFEASRTLEILFDDISKWYLRRSRRQLQKPESVDALERQAAFLGFLLLDLSRIMAPFTPFLAEHIWQQVKQRLTKADLVESVHLDKWPKDPPSGSSRELFRDMNLVRSVVAVGHAIRAKENIPVQTPLGVLLIDNTAGVIANNKDYHSIIQDEANVEQVQVVGGEMKEDGNIKVLAQEGVTVGLDTTITNELRLKGEERKYIRNYQALRKKNGFSPGDKAEISEPKNSDLEEFYGDAARLARIQDATNSTVVLVSGLTETTIKKMNL